jgi:hypothetical protein
MRILGQAALLVALVAPQIQESIAAPRADIQLKQASATLTNASDTTWTLEKLGSLGPSTVTWQANATAGAATPGLLIVNGIFRVENKGTAAATIGNIVVNLQTKAGNRWVTVSSDVANATEDDDATSANVAAKATSENNSLFTENAASGPLLFTDATTNSAFALVPQVTIAAKTIRKLRFSATYRNSVLNLAVGTQVRAEILVSFGNAKAGGSSAPNIDINGNGIIDADEQWVETVASKLTGNVPAPVPSNSDVVLTDSPSDITTTGTVTFSNPVITIYDTQALAVVNYDAGSSGGTITNCAHLTGSTNTALVEGDSFTNLTAVDLTACSTITVGGHACAPGVGDCGWEVGDMVSYGQDSWGGLPTTSPAAGLVVANFDSVYGGGVEIGIPINNGWSVIFTSASAILNYLPSSGPPGPLTADLVDPTSTSSGLFGGFLLALQLDVDFADRDVIGGTSPLQFGDLYVCGLPTMPLFDNMTIRQILAAMNVSIGGGAAEYSYEDLTILTNDLATAFEGGAPSLFAQDHIFATPCP